MSGRKSPGVVLALAACIAALAIVPYVPCLEGRPIWDDDPFLFENPILMRPDALRTIWATLEGHDYWPVSYTFFHFMLRTFGNYLVPYHVANAVLHAATALLFWRVLARLGLEWGVVPAALFAAHPVNVEAVAWIFQAKTLLAGLFAMASAAAFLEYDATGKRAYVALTVIAFVLAMLAKTSIVMLFAAFPLLAIYGRRPVRRAVEAAVPCGVAAAVLGGIAFHAHRVHYLVGTGVVRDDSLLERTLGAFAAFVFYLSKALAPVGLSFVYPRWALDLRDPLVWLPMIGTVIGFGILIRYRNTWGRVPAIVLAIYALLLAPVLGFVDIPFMQFSLVADHWQYPAIAAPLALSAPVAAAIARRSTKAAPAVALAVSLALAAGSWSRSLVFVDEISVYRDAAERAPDNFMVRLNLGKALVTARDRLGAVREFTKAAEIDPRSTDALNNLASALAETGDPEQAARRYREALAIDPSHVEANYNLGNLLLRMGKLEEAVARYDAVIERVPDHVEAHANAGAALAQLGKLEAARPHFERAVALSPKNAELWINLARVLGNLGDLPAAERAAKEALHVRPSSTRAQILAGFLVAKQGRTEEARQLYLEAMLMASPEMRAEIQNALEQLNQPSP
jgi:tetratricopeptide (TPR) repeat protein